jgi:ABC-type glycerol-3-phosphate transport system substrate-binding protein
MKKLLIVFGLLLAAGLVFADGKQEQPAGAKPKSVMMWGAFPNNNVEIEARVQEIEANYGIDFTIETVPSNVIAQRIQMGVAGGEDVCDLIDWGAPLIGFLVHPDPARSLLTPLNPWLKNSKVAGTVLKSRFAPLTVKDNIYGLPNDMHPCLFVYNMDAFKEAGVDIEAIKTFDEFFNTSKKALKDTDGDGRNDTYSFSATGMYPWLGLIVANNLAVSDSDGNLNFMKPEFVEFLKKYDQWYKTGGIMQWDWAQYWNSVGEGKLLTAVAPDWWIWTALNTVKEDSPAYGRLRITELPAYKAGGPRTYPLGGSYRGMIKTEKTAKYGDFMFELLEDLAYSEAALKSRYTESHIIAPLPAVWDDPIFDKEYPLFGGQKYARKAIEYGKTMTAVARPLYEAPMSHILSTYWQNVIDGSMSIEEVLKKAQKDGEASIKRMMSR